VLVVTHGLPRATAGAFLEAVALFMILSNWTELGAAGRGADGSAPRALGRGGDLRALVRTAVVPVALAEVPPRCSCWCLQVRQPGVVRVSARSGKTFWSCGASTPACVLTLLLAVTRVRADASVRVDHKRVPGRVLIAVAG
jgi:hypothetical protein